MKSALFLSFCILAACSSTETSSSSSSGSSGSSGASGSSNGGNGGGDDGGASSGDAASDASSNTNLGARCGYEKGCVAAATNIFCSSKPGTKQYQCCKPAEPGSTAGCTAMTQGTTDDIGTYCCTGTP